MEEGSQPSREDEAEDKPCGYPHPDAILVDTYYEVTTKNTMGADCKRRGTIPSKGHLEPLLLGGGITQDEIAHQPGSQTNFSGRSEARDISLIRGNARQSCARPSVPLKIKKFSRNFISRSLQPYM